MSININENYSISIFTYIPRSPVARYVDAPLAEPVAGQRMIIEDWMKRLFYKNTEALIKLPANFNRNFLIAFLKSAMKFRNHYELR